MQYDDSSKIDGSSKMIIFSALAQNLRRLHQNMLGSKSPLNGPRNGLAAALSGVCARAEQRPCLVMSSVSDTPDDAGGNNPAAGDSLFGALGRRLNVSCPVRTRREQKLADREEELLDHAQHLIEQEGFASFTMDSLVKVCGYSKGTLYNHFSGKEDCLGALCLRGLSVLEGLFERAIAFNGNHREKILALNVGYQIYGQLQPTLALALITVRTPAFSEKISAARSERIQQMDIALTSRVDEVFRAAMAAGELADDIHVSALSFMSWAQAYGGATLLHAAQDLTAVTRVIGSNISLISSNVLLDGMGFRPLSKDWDYQNSWQRIEQECFAEEVALLNSQ
ncbi:MAG: TetR family transcriptional regulator [Oleibacter sp.]|nr:TetR family transcriptional regulator [Thalassolituus sp.]